MVRCLFGLSFLLVTFSSLGFQTALSPENIQTTLSRGETLYYEAQFKESIQLLIPLDLALAKQPSHIQDSVKVKLQLALAYIGLDETSAARTRFSELSRLDPNYVLDPDQFAPKVLALFNEARNEQSRSKCSDVCDEAHRLLNDANLQGLLMLLQSAPKTCSCVQDVAQDAADLAFKQGVEEYKNNDIPPSLKSFRMALTFNPNHEISKQYVELAQNKLQLTVDRLLLDWRKRFEAGEFSEAAAVYRQIRSPELAEKSAPALELTIAEYRQHASTVVHKWKANCSADVSGLSLDTVEQVNAILPDPSIARDILEEIKPCAPSAPPPPKAQPCLQLQTQEAMVRLKNRVDPQIPRAVRPTSPTSFVLKINIDKSGNVSVKDVQSPNLALNGPIKAAVEKWKFAPALVEEDQPRCVDTELPILLNP